MSDDGNPTPSQQSLPLEIKAATREMHDALNRLITSRIRLCLPPHTQDPQIYALGLSVFGSIYTIFEWEWIHLLNRRRPDNPRITNILRTVHIPNLLRSRSLEHELANLKPSRPNTTTHETASKMFDTHQNAIKTSIRVKPHALLAYTWVMYMALFNGGRIIRTQLSSVPPAFWQHFQPPSSSNINFNAKEEAHDTLSQHIQFWNFDNDNDKADGNAIKEEFKNRFNAATTQLTASERSDVVDEAVRIYAMLREMVDWLDTNAKAGNEISTSTR